MPFIAKQDQGKGRGVEMELTIAKAEAGMQEADEAAR